MVTIFIITHGPLADALKQSSKMFFNESADSIISIGLYPEDSIDQLKKRITSHIKDKYTSDGILIFVDIFAGSPFNMATLAMGEMVNEYPNIQCFTGVNLPILMEALAQINSSSLEEIVNHIEEISSSSIINVRKQLNF